jgi:hypothetical protein
MSRTTWTSQSEDCFFCELVVYLHGKLEGHVNPVAPEKFPVLLEPQVLSGDIARLTTTDLPNKISISFPETMLLESRMARNEALSCILKLKLIQAAELKVISNVREHFKIVRTNVLLKRK